MTMRDARLLGALVLLVACATSCGSGGSESRHPPRPAPYGYYPAQPTPGPYYYGQAPAPAARFSECAAVPTFGAWRPTERELLDTVLQVRGGFCFNWGDPNCPPGFNPNQFAEAVSRCSRVVGSTSLQMRVLLETRSESCHQDCAVRVRAAESNGRRWLSVMSVPGHAADYHTDAFELRRGVPVVYLVGETYNAAPCAEGAPAAPGDPMVEDFRRLPVPLRKFICNFE